MLRRISALVLVFASVFAVFAGCSVSENANVTTSLHQPVITETVEVRPGEFGAELAMFNCIKQSLGAEKSNFMFSPFSAELALMMLANGAQGETRREILDFYGVEDLQAYNQNAKSIIGKNSDWYELNIANSIWLNTDRAAQLSGAEFSADFKQTVGDYYYAQAGLVDKSNAVKNINSWISEKTKGRIENAINDAEFLAALVNTIYFKSDWLKEFTAEDTRTDDFTDADNQVQQTEFMHQTDFFRYFESDKMQVLEMPYMMTNTSMYVFLPKAGEQVELDQIRTAMNGMESYEVKVKMPKFKTDFAVELKEVMQALGIKAAFDEFNLDIRDVMFESVSPEYFIYVNAVIQKTFIQVDEKGTEAAAVTAIVVMPTSAPPEEKPQPKEFTADHPFVYMIYDNENKTVLFMGDYSYVE